MLTWWILVAWTWIVWGSSAKSSLISRLGIPRGWRMGHLHLEKKNISYNILFKSVKKRCFYRWRLSCIGKCVRVQCRRRCHRRGRGRKGLTLAPGSRIGAPAGVLIGQYLNSSCVPFERHICIVCRFNQHTVL